MLIRRALSTLAFLIASCSTPRTAVPSTSQPQIATACTIERVNGADEIPSTPWMLRTRDATQLVTFDTIGSIDISENQVACERFDFDGDGADDIVATDARSERVYAWIGESERFRVRPRIFHERLHTEGSRSVAVLLSDTTDEFFVWIRGEEHTVLPVEHPYAITPHTAFEDINGDGHLDVVLESTCGSGGCFHAYFMFNPSTRRFVFDEALSALINPVPNSAKREIDSWLVHHGGEHRKYRFTPVGLQLLLEEIHDEAFVNDGVGYHLTIRRLIDGEMQLTCDETLDQTQNVVRRVVGDDASCRAEELDSTKIH